MMLSDVCLSDAYNGPKSRTERPRKTKIGTEVAHVTRDSDTTSKVKGQGPRGRGHIVAASAQLVIIFITLRAKLTGAVYCYQSCL